jgi:hypothetical protein
MTLSTRPVWLKHMGIPVAMYCKRLICARQEYHSQTPDHLIRRRKPAARSEPFVPGVRFQTRWSVFGQLLTNRAARRKLT